MDKKTQAKQESQLRVPKAKTSKFGLSVPIIRMPHDDLIKPEIPKLEIVSITEPAENDSMPSQTSLTRHTRESEIAPTRNFQKVANSISNLAIPDGWFKGKSKQLYDALYSLTRGAINPSRKIRVQKSKLMKLAAIGSRITFDSNIEHLISSGLVVETVLPGEHGGNEFEVFLPEEITLTSQTRQTSLTSSAQKLDRLVCLETSQTRQSLNSIDTDISGDPKTLFKTRVKTDDEGFELMLEILREGCERITGKKPSAQDSQKWAELGRVLILELEIGAKRTESVSNAPAFLAEILRRRFFSSRSGAAEVTIKNSRGQIDLVGKSDIQSSGEVVPLDRQGREDARAQLREFAGESFLGEFEKWYTAEDWKWIVENLEVK